MFWFYILISAAVDGLLVYTGGLVSSVVDLWKPVLIFIGLFVGLILLHLAAFVLYSLTASKTE